jgi:hypothetical protein
MTYPYTPKYVNSPTGFGILYIKGNLTTSELGNFKFVAAADLDYNGTATKGAGRICTVIPWEAPPVNGSVTKVLIGEITNYTLTASKISGTLSLRYYDKTKGEIDNNWTVMTLSGVLGADVVDNITNTVSLIQFTQDNLVTWSNKTVAMEESTSRREVPQTITSGYLGAGGTLTLNRTGVMSYLRVSDMNLPAQSVHAIRNTQDNWGSNYTNSTGKSYSIVVVDMVDFTETGVDQQAYTWEPTYSPGYAAEGYFVGFESFLIAATHIDLDENVFGTDYTFNLLPTPVVSSVSPNVGQPGQSFNVTINGKWFLVNETYNPLTISFGPNVTVNSHAVVNDTAITANITIGGGAVGASNVSVTKRGLTGALSGGFGVGSAVNVPVAFPGGWVGSKVEPFAVKLFQAGNLSNVLWAGNVFTNSTGVLTITGITPGTYDIGIKSANCLSEVNYSVTLVNGTNVAGVAIRSGDVNATDYIDMGDYSDFSTAFNTLPCSAKWNAGADLDRSGYIDMGDYSLFSAYFGQLGDAWGKF